MKAIFFKELRLTRKLLIIWIALVALLTGFAAIEFVVLKDTLGQLAELTGSFPKIVLVMFGLNGVDIGTPVGLYQCMTFWTNLLAFFFAGFLGVYAVAREEKFGTSEFLFTKPYKLKDIVLAKFWAAVVNLAIFAAVVWLASFLCIVLPIGDMGVVALHTAATAGMLFTQIVLFSIGLLISGAAKNYKAASLFTMLAVAAFYVINFVVDYAGTLDFLVYFTPVRYFEVMGVTRGGLNIGFISLSAGIIICCLFAARLLVDKKDFRSV